MTDDLRVLRTVVFSEPWHETGSLPRQLLVTLWSNGTVEVAERPYAGAVWGASWEERP